MEEHLIELVREHPAIFNKQHKDYYDRRGVVANIWSNVAVQMKEVGFDECGGKSYL